MGTLFQRCHNCDTEYQIEWSPRDGWRPTNLTFCSGCWAEWTEKKIRENGGEVLKRLPYFLVARTKAGKRFVTNGSYAWKISLNVTEILCEAKWAESLRLSELFSLDFWPFRRYIQVCSYNEEEFLKEAIKKYIVSLQKEAVVRKFHDGSKHLFCDKDAEKMGVKNLQQFLEEES